MSDIEAPNPHYHTVLEATNQWGIELGMLRLVDERTVRKLGEISASVVADIGPGFERKGYERFAKQIAAFFWADGWDGEFNPPSEPADSQSEAPEQPPPPPEFFELIESIDNTLSRPEAATRSDNPYVKMWGHIALWTAEDVAPWQDDYWQDWTKKYMQGLTEERKHRVEGTVPPTYEEYLTLRQKTAAVHVVTLAAAAAVRLRLPQELWDNVDLTEARELTSFIVAIDNDIVSYDHELEEGRPDMNIVSYMLGPGEDEAEIIQNAKDKATGIRDEKYDRLIKIREELEASDADPLILQYIDVALLGWIHGYRNYVKRMARVAEAARAAKKDTAAAHESNRYTVAPSESQPKI